MTTTMVPLGSVAELDRDGIDPSEITPKSRYVGLEHIESDGSVANAPTVDRGDLTSTKFRFSSRHVLFGKLRPYLRKVARPSFDGICSTDIIPILPTSRVDRNYLFHFLRTDAVIDRAARLSVGMNLPRINPRDLLQFEIPLPSLNEQRRIARILDQADDLRRKQLSAVALLRELGHALYRESFASPNGEEPRFPSALFGDLVADTKIGLVRGAAEFGPGMTYPYVRMNAITRDQEIDFSTVMATEASETESREYSLVRGDFLFNTRNSRDLVGKSALWPGPGGYLFNNNIMRVRFKGYVEPAYVLAAFRDPRVAQELENRKSGTTSVFAIYWQQLKTLPIPLPAITAQRAFAKRIGSVEAMKSLSRRRLAKLDELFASLQHRAFAGSLKTLPIEANFASI